MDGELRLIRSACSRHILNAQTGPDIRFQVCGRGDFGSVGAANGNRPVATVVEPVEPGQLNDIEIAERRSELGIKVGKRLWSGRINIIPDYQQPSGANRGRRQIQLRIRLAVIRIPIQQLILAQIKRRIGCIEQFKELKIIRSRIIGMNFRYVQLGPCLLCWLRLDGCWHNQRSHCQAKRHHS
ncbi:hypothetical protein D3C81_1651200 [compost metagenome]